MQFPSQEGTAIGIKYWQILTLNKLSEVWTLEQGGAGMCTIATSSSNYTKEGKIIFCHLYCCYDAQVGKYPCCCFCKDS